MARPVDTGVCSAPIEKDVYLLLRCLPSWGVMRGDSTMQVTCYPLPHDNMAELVDDGRR